MRTERDARNVPFSGSSLSLSLHLKPRGHVGDLAVLARDGLVEVVLHGRVVVSSRRVLDADVADRDARRGDDSARGHRSGSDGRDIDTDGLDAVVLLCACVCCEERRRETRTRVSEASVDANS